MPLVVIREKSQVTLPRQVMLDYGLRVGDMVDIEVQGKTLKLTPKDPVDREILAGRKDYREGRVKIFDTPEAMVASLHASAKKKKAGGRF